MLPPLAAELAATGPHWAHELAPSAEWLAREILASWGETPGLEGRTPRLSKLVQEVPSVLSQDRRRAAHGTANSRHREVAARAMAGPQPRRRCLVCGAPLRDRRARYCPACAEAHGLESVGRAIATRRANRAGGRDYTPAGRRALRERQRANKRAEAAWRQAHPEGADREAYRREILPRLQGLRTVELHRALGLARPQCVAIREGRRIPHPRHWDRLRTLVANR